MEIDENPNNAIGIDGDDEKTEILNDDRDYQDIMLNDCEAEEVDKLKKDEKKSGGCTTSFCYLTFFNTNLKMCMWGTLVLLLGILVTIVAIGYATDDISVLSSSSKASSSKDGSLSTAADTTKPSEGTKGGDGKSIATKVPGVTWEDVVCSGKPRGTIFDASFDMNINGKLVLINMNDVDLSFKETDISFYYPSVAIGAKVGTLNIESNILKAQDELSVELEGTFDDFTTIAANSIGTFNAVSLGTDGELTFINPKNETNTLTAEIRCLLTWELDDTEAEVTCYGGERQMGLGLRSNQQG